MKKINVELTDNELWCIVAALNLSTKNDKVISGNVNTKKEHEEIFKKMKECYINTFN